MSEVDTYIASVHFQKDGAVQPSLDFWRALEIYCLENKIGFELLENGKHKRTCKIALYIPCRKITVKHHGRMRDPCLKKEKVKKKSKPALSELFKIQ